MVDDLVSFCFQCSLDLLRDPIGLLFIIGENEEWEPIPRFAQGIIKKELDKEPGISLSTSFTPLTGMILGWSFSILVER